MEHIGPYILKILHYYVLFKLLFWKQIHPNEYLSTTDSEVEHQGENYHTPQC